MPIDRTLPEVLQLHGDSLKNDFRKILPGKVMAVHTSRQTVDVQLSVNNFLFDDLGNIVSDPAPSVSDVPLCVMRGGGFLVWLPVAVGDSVLVVFSDLACDTWRAGDGEPRDPVWAGKHTLASGFAIPCIAPDKHALASVSASNVVIGKDGADEQIVISASDIKLGASASDFVALASKVDAIMTLLKTLSTQLATAMPILATAASPGPMIALGPDAAAYTAVGAAASALQSGIASVAATLVKAK